MLISVSILLIFIACAIGYHFRENRHSSFCLADMIVSLITSLMIAFSFDTCPFFKGRMEPDSTVFIYISRRMHEGKIPYRDLFDHKGPALYFLEYFGSFFGTYGIWVLLTISLFLAVLLSVFTVRLISDRQVVQYAVPVILYFVFGWILFPYGNYVEVLALPWICFALYVFSKLFTKGEYRSGEVMLSGFSLVMAAMLKANMIGIWVGYILLIIVYFIRKKGVKSLFSSAGLFMSGFVIALIPFLIYLSITESFEDFYDSYISFNLLYASTGDGGGPANISDYLISLERTVIYLLPEIVCTVISVFLKYQKKILMTNMFCLVLSGILSLMAPRIFAHYLVAMLPVFIIPVAIVIEKLYGYDYSMLRNIRIKKDAFALIIVLLCVILAVACPVIDCVTNRYTSAVNDDLADYIEKNTSKDDDVLFVNSGAYFYLVTERSTENKYFYQCPPVVMSQKLKDDFWNELEKVRSDYIIISNGFMYDMEPRYEFADELEKKLLSMGYIVEKHNCYNVYHF